MSPQEFIVEELSRLCRIASRHRLTQSRRALQKALLAVSADDGQERAVTEFSQDELEAVIAQAMGRDSQTARRLEDRRAANGPRSAIPFHRPGPA